MIVSWGQRHPRVPIAGIRHTVVLRGGAVIFQFYPPLEATTLPDEDEEDDGQQPSDPTAVEDQIPGHVQQLDVWPCSGGCRWVARCGSGRGLSGATRGEARVRLNDLVDKGWYLKDARTACGL